MKISNKSDKLSTSELKLLSEEFIGTYSDKSLQTIKTYQKALNEFLFFYDVDKEFYFDSEDVIRYKNYLQTRKRMQDYSIHTYLTALRRFFNYLKNKSILTTNPAKDIKQKLNRKNGKTSFLTSKQIKSITDNISRKQIPGLRDIAVIGLISCTGRAESDLSAMKCSDFKIFRKNYIIVFKRNNEECRLILPDHIGMAINEYLFERDKGAPSKDSPLFASHSNRSANQAITIRGLREMLKQRIEQSSINETESINFTPLALRQSGAVYLASIGKKPEEIMSVLQLKFKPTAERNSGFIKQYNQ